MSILTRPLGRPKDVGDTPSSVSTAVSKPAKARKTVSPALSLSPRADLLPPEIGQNHRRRAVRRNLRVMVIVAVFLAVVGIGGAWYYSFSKAQALTTAQNDTTQLVADQAKYAEVSSTLVGIDQGKAALRVGGGMDVDWSSYLSRLQATLPAGVALTNVTIDSADSEKPYVQSTTPLEESRIATLTFTAKSETLPSIPDWIDGLSSLPGFADASPNSVNSADPGYTADITMHINTKALSARFDKDAVKEDDK